MKGLGAVRWEKAGLWKVGYKTTKEGEEVLVKMPVGHAARIKEMARLAGVSVGKLLTVLVVLSVAEKIRV